MQNLDVMRVSGHQYAQRPEGEVFVKDDNITDIATYLRLNATELGERILSSYPALHSPQDKPSPLLSQLLRRPYPAQALAIMGVMRRWHLAHNANVVAECGAGKTLIALGSMFVHSAGRPFSALVMAPPHLVLKWGRETIQTLPNVRVFLIEDMRNGGNPREPHGIHEARLRRGEIVREGMHTTLAELRRLGTGRLAKAVPRVRDLLHGALRKPSCLIFGSTATGKAVPEKFLGALTNPDTGCPIETDGIRLSVPDFEKKRLHEVVEVQKRGPQDIPRSGRPTATRSSAWPRPSLWAVICTNGLTTPWRMNCTNWRAIRHKAMRSACWHAPANTSLG